MTRKIGYTEEQVAARIDRDRVKGFVTLAENLPPSAKMAVMTADQARSIARMLRQHGFDPNE